MIPMTSTILAYNDYLDGGLFRDAAFPDSVDKNIAVNTILINAGEFEPLFKDAEYMRQAVTLWAAKWAQAFDRWALAFNEEYNPLHNYDRFEEVTETHDDETTNKLDAATTTDDVNTNTRSAFDSSKYEPHDQSTMTGTGTSTSDGSGTDKGTFERKAHLYGNIGVTTAAQMLTGELEVRKHNLYNMIADCFATELTLMIY